jgi:hypothetical protein
MVPFFMYKRVLNHPTDHGWCLHVCVCDSLC